MTPAPVLFIPHGGGPLPLLEMKKLESTKTGTTPHESMVRFLQEITPTLGKPSAILVISAHWEEHVPTITSGKSPSLIYDYYGFPDESYEIQYPAPGDPELARTIHQLLAEHGIEAVLDDQRGFDHGLFVPLKIMYPDASIPCVQLSLLNNLDAGKHVQIGKALSELRNQDILVLGSGFSFHNLRAMMSGTPGQVDEQNEDFEQWLVNTCTDASINEEERAKQLSEWGNAPSARYCHPREEHLLPLHVCYGMGQSAAKLVFNDYVIGKKTSAFLW
ncbi:DODA-type extradiol aromatic ring-opening family dioxygenase [Kaarinaea lacus]